MLVVDRLFIEDAASQRAATRSRVAQLYSGGGGEASMTLIRRRPAGLSSVLSVIRDSTNVQCLLDVLGPVHVPSVRPSVCPLHFISVGV